MDLEIKLRAWDLLLKKWARAGNVEMGWNNKGDYGGEYYPFLSDTTQCDPRYAVTQSLRFNDIHYSEVYDRDIVFVNEDNFIVKLDLIRGVRFVDENNVETIVDMQEMEQYRIELVGNVWETPELMIPVHA